MPTPVNVAVIYYSSTGTVHALAKAAADEAAGVDGADVRLRRVRELAPDSAIESNANWVAHRNATRDIPEATLDDLDWADVFMLGTPTRYGLPTSQLKQFIDQSSPLWEAGKLVNKVATSFTSSATTHGGQESTILSLNNTFYHWGCIIVPPGYADPVQFKHGNPYGASHVGGTPGQPLPGEDQLNAMRFQSRRTVSVGQALLRGGLTV
ncbi:NAD(P)H dehydrogenase (quinone) [Stackebrandtia endophytica]|uniref:NAD(P)H dehydrogenase (Quinone) n=1 Tax=Stackebrandtia endophytica TaxID=1496996 RepID=A0A543B063_9ACTN|nr:NAD(P)H:quinone oxidoreductase [Stackebrandtia endophytica]TQL78221.1 NAD(P)H dehydrogenase (quinone) [Stackebrandtia endophytica]